MKEIIYRFLTPSMKCKIKRFLHTIYRIKNRQNKVQSCVPITRLSDNKSDLFFGYYDVSPFNESGNKLLCTKREEDSKVKIIIYDLQDRTINEVATSRSWNWQQGCRLRWLSNNVISFNDYENGSYINKILELKTGLTKTIDWPLYDISNDNSIGISLNFERLGYLRPGYGYRCQNIDPSEFNDDGFIIINIKTNSVIKRITLHEIHEIVNSKCDLSQCYINHISFNQASDKFLFFWIEIVDGYHKASLIVYDITMNRFSVLENQYKVSHYVWESTNSIICTAYLTPIECKYFRYHIKEQNRELLAESILNCDGHPSLIDENEIITDTYPDKNGFQYLYCANIESHEKKDILKVYSNPTPSGEKRTDLHPRLNHKKNRVCIDARINKKREVLILELNK